MTKNQRPECRIIAGPNGSGKTTLTRCLDGRNLIIGRYINADEIAQQKFGDWNNPEAIFQAAKEADQQRRIAIEEKADFTFETVFSSPEKLQLLHHINDQGYFVRLYFIATETPTINAARITQRVMAGGHDVPIPKIITRYEKSLRNLMPALPLAQITQIFDNSVQGIQPSHSMSFVGTKLHKIRQQPLPDWCENIFATILNVETPDIHKLVTTETLREDFRKLPLIHHTSTKLQENDYLTWHLLFDALRERIRENPELSPDPLNAIKRLKAAQRDLDERYSQYHDGRCTNIQTLITIPNRLQEKQKTGINIQQTKTVDTNKTL